MMGIVMTSQIPLHATLMVETVVELTLTHTIVMCAHVLKKLIVHQQQVCINTEGSRLMLLLGPGKNSQ